MSSAPRTRPKYYDLNLAHLPAPGLLSILHRVSGLLLFFPVLPGVLLLVTAALASEADYADVRDFFSRPLVKLAFIGITWAFAHHFWAGVRYLLLDLHWQVAKDAARRSALIVLALGIATTILIAWRIWW